jgi:hypothetical protein
MVFAYAEIASVAAVALTRCCGGGLKMWGNWLDRDGSRLNIIRGRSPAVRLAVAVATLLLLSAGSTVRADTPTIAVSRTSATYVENDATFYVDPAIQVSDSHDITGAKVSIGTGFSVAQDRLAYATTAGVVGSYNATTGVLTLTSTASASSYQAALRAVRYENSSDTPSTASRVITFSLGSGALYNETTGHYYEFVAHSGISWSEARAEAEGVPRKLYGLQGYLATITSPEENAFLTAKVSGTAWIGATDVASEGVWQWVTGPEAGTQFCAETGGGGYGNPTGGYAAVGSSYNNWSGGEPNNSGSNEDYCHMMSWTDPPGKWNDLPDGGGGGDYASTGYVVEYGGMAGDPTVQLSASITVSVTAVNDPPTISSVSNQAMTEDTTRTVSLSATDVEGNTPIGFSVSGGSVSTVSGSISGSTLTLTPAANYFTSSPITFTVTATDSLGAPSSVTFSVTVAPVNDAPVNTVEHDERHVG